MSDTIYSPLAAFSPTETLFPVAETVAPGEDFIVNTQAVGMPSQPTTQAPASFPAYNPQFRTYTPPAPGSFDPFTVGITGAIPAFFGPRSEGNAAEVSIIGSGDGTESDGVLRLPPLTFVPNAPGQTTLGGGPAGGTYVASPEGPPAQPGTGNFLTDLQSAFNNPGMRTAALTMLTGPAAIPSLIAGTALSQFGNDPRVNTIGGALRDLLVDYFTNTPEARGARRETNEGLNREAQRDSDSRSGITVEDLSPLQNITETYQPTDTTTQQPTDTTTQQPVATTETPFGTFSSGESALDALYDTVLSRDPEAGAEAYWLDRVANVGWQNALREFEQGAALELAAKNYTGRQEAEVTTEGSPTPAERGPAGAPGTGNIAQDFASFVSEPAVQDAALSFGLGALTGGIGPGIAAASRGIMSGGLADALADQLGLDKNVPSTREALAAVLGFAPDVFSPSSGLGDKDAAVDSSITDSASSAVDGGTPGDKGGPGDGGEKGDPGDSGFGGQASESGGDMGGGAPGDSGDGYKEGGLVAFAEGGLVPLAGGGKIAIGPGGGLDDLIPTSINGRRAAALSDGEFVIPADVVSMMGDGSSNAGARRLYDLVKQVRGVKTGTTKQAGPLPVGDILKRSMGR